MVIQMGKTLAFTAVSGMVAGLAGCASSPPPDAEMPAPPADPAAEASAAGAKDCCRGKNECKGKGGCKHHDCAAAPAAPAEADPAPAQ